MLKIWNTADTLEWLPRRLVRRRLAKIQKLVRARLVLGGRQILRPVLSDIEFAIRRHSARIPLQRVRVLPRSRYSRLSSALYGLPSNRVSDEARAQRYRPKRDRIKAVRKGQKFLQMAHQKPRRNRRQLSLYSRHYGSIQKRSSARRFAALSRSEKMPLTHGRLCHT